jgi:hypothetical protein
MMGRLPASSSPPLNRTDAKPATLAPPTPYCRHRRHPLFSPASSLFLPPHHTQAPSSIASSTAAASCVLSPMTSCCPGNLFFNVVTDVLHAPERHSRQLTVAPLPWSLACILEDSKVFSASFALSVVKESRQDQLQQRPRLPLYLWSPANSDRPGPLSSSPIMLPFSG